jgi:hypothetical protein
LATTDPTRRPARGWVDDLGQPITRQLQPRKSLANKPWAEQLLHAAALLAVVAVLGAWSAWAIRSGFRQHLPPWAPWPFIAAAWAFIVVDLWRRRAAGVQIPRLLKRGECPGCLYALAGLPAEAVEHIESAVRCPECGAVWRAERVGQGRGAKEKPRAEPGA